jgi:hypothetical protein
MKHGMKKLLAFIMVMAAILSTATVTAFADDGTSSETGNVTVTVPVDGTIDALMISITHPTTLAYTIDPNSGEAGTFIAPDIPITNNTKVPVNVTVQSLKSCAGGTIQFTDVGSNDRDWSNLNLADSKKYIALGIKVKDATGWNTGYDQGVHYAFNFSPILMGSLPVNATGNLTLVANFGLAFDQSYTAMHNLVLMFNLV